MTTILIDGNSVGYAEHYATKLRSGNLETQAIFGFMRKVREMRLAYPNCTLLVLWDGRAQFRFDMLPTYKSNRDDDPKKAKIKQAYVEQRPYIGRALSCLGVRQVTASNLEADDLAGYFVGRFDGTSETIVLLSSDRDWIQLVRPGVIWRDPRKDGVTITDADFFDKTGYKTPLAYLEGKCLQGDTSDVVPGVGGIGEGRASLILAEFGSVMEFWRKVDSGEHVPKKAYEIKLATTEARVAFRRNMRMVQLFKPPEPKDVRIEQNKFDADKLKELCEELAFFSILKNFDNYTQPFLSK